MNKKSNQPERKNFLKQRSGAIAVMFALTLPVLLIIFGFCIDYANMQRVRNEAQVVADLCSKAAADTLVRSEGDEALAIKSAQAVASANSIAGAPHSLDASEIIFGRASAQADGSFVFSAGATPPNSVRVNASRTNAHPNGSVGLFFGNFYGRSGFELTQTATSSFRDVEVCLVLDRSVSMKWAVVGETASSNKRAIRCAIPNAGSRWIALDRAVEALLGEFDTSPVSERVALVTFATDVSDSCSQGTVITASKLDQPLTSNTSEIRDVMEDYKNSIWFGGTDITAGIVEAKDHMIAKASIARERFIIVMTDGTHRGDEEPSDAAAECAAAGIVVHTVTFSDEADIADMKLTALKGRGEHHHANDIGDLEDVFRRLAGSFAIITE